jgi:hypothetical protein
MLQLRLSRSLYETRANRGYVGDEKNEGIREGKLGIKLLFGRIIGS